MNPYLDNASRRRLLGTLGAGAIAGWSTLSFGAASAKASDKRFVFVILRGGLDGLSAVPAIGDTEFAAARGTLTQFPGTTLPLDSTFALHPHLAQLHAMYGRGELAVVHAVGLPYRERSHSMRSRCSRAAARGRTSSPPAGSAVHSRAPAARASR